MKKKTKVQSLNQNDRRIFISAIAGNVLEYYEFTVYAVFAASIGRFFFPAQQEFTQVLYSLGVFSLGFVTRPLGGIFFGMIGDRFGRKVSLVISMLGMTIPTFIIGVIPSYEYLGIYATLILVLMRLIQGLCISGEGAGAAVFILEHKKNLKPGLTASLVHAANIAGTMLASLVGFFLGKYSSFEEYNWRIAFILGAFMGSIGFYFRLKVAETPIFLALAEKRDNLRYPFFYMIKNSYKSVFVTFCLGACASSIVYFMKSYINIYYGTFLKYSTTSSTGLLFFSSCSMMLFMPLSGYISDRFGRLKAIQIFSILVFVSIFPVLFTMSLCPYNIFLQMSMLFLIAACAGLISGSAYIFIISLFSSKDRFSGVSFSYNLGVALCGGTSAYVSSLLVKKTGLTYAPSFYIMVVSGIFLVILFSMKKTISQIIFENSKII